MPENTNHIGPHGIDITAPGGIAALMDFHRQTFGDAVMEADGDGDGGDDAGNDGGDSGNDSGKDSAGDNSGSDSGNDDTGKDGDKGKDAGDNPWTDPDKAKAEIEKLRRENATKRAAPKDAAAKAENDLIQKMGKALGLVKGDAKASPEELTQKLTEQQQAANQANLQLSVYKNAGDGDPDELLDSNRFLNHIKDVDPTDTKKLKAEIAAFVKDNPKFKAARAAGQTGADRTGGSGETRSKKTGSLSDALNAHYGA